MRAHRHAVWHMGQGCADVYTTQPVRCGDLTFLQALRMASTSPCLQAQGGSEGGVRSERGGRHRTGGRAGGGGPGDCPVRPRRHLARRRGCRLQFAHTHQVGSDSETTLLRPSATTSPVVELTTRAPKQPPGGAQVGGWQAVALVRGVGPAGPARGPAASGIPGGMSWHAGPPVCAGQLGSWEAGRPAEEPSAAD